MAITLDTVEFQLDTVGAVAVQQTLDALGVKAESINASTDGSNTPAVYQEKNGSRETEGGEGEGQALDLTPVLEALDRQTEILERIASAIDNQKPAASPRY